MRTWRTMFEKWSSLFIQVLWIHNGVRSFHSQWNSLDVVEMGASPCSNRAIGLWSEWVWMGGVWNRCENLFYRSEWKTGWITTLVEGSSIVNRCESLSLQLYPPGVENYETYKPPEGAANCVATEVCVYYYTFAFPMHHRLTTKLFSTTRQRDFAKFWWMGHWTRAWSTLWSNIVSRFLGLA